MENYAALPQVGFVEANKLALQKIIEFKGRTRRSEFWWAMLGIIIVTLLTSWIPVVGSIVAVVATIMEISLTFRRLHDTNRSGWWIGGTYIFSLVLLGFFFAIFGTVVIEAIKDPSYELDTAAFAVANIGALVAWCVGLFILVIIQLVILVFCCIDSDVNANKYGESTKYQPLIP